LIRGIFVFGPGPAGAGHSFSGKGRCNLNTRIFCPTKNRPIGGLLFTISFAVYARRPSRGSGTAPVIPASGIDALERALTCQAWTSDVRQRSRTTGLTASRFIFNLGVQLTQLIHCLLQAAFPHPLIPVICNLIHQDKLSPLKLQLSNFRVGCL